MEKLKSLRQPSFDNFKRGRTKRDSRRFARTRNFCLNERLRHAMAHDIALCEHCEMEDKPFRASQRVELHHVLPRRERPDLTYVAWNLQFLCGKHHAYRTKLEQQERFPFRWIVTGKPGYGKTTLIQNLKKPNAIVWDLDVEIQRFSSPGMPLTINELNHVLDMRKKWVAQAISCEREAWLIARWPSTAYKIAIQMGARVIEIIKPIRSQEDVKSNTRGLIGTELYPC